MRWFCFLGLSLLVSCGGSLNDEQRKQLREGRELQSIKKVNEADILEQAFRKGRDIMKILEKHPSSADSLEEKQHVKLNWLVPGAGNASDIERQLIDAYLNSMIMGEELTDNVQKLGTDSLLYTKPIVTALPNGAVEVIGTWNVRMSVKQLVLAMDK